MRQIDLQDAETTIAVFREGAAANRDASCRRGSIDLIEPPGTLIATGDPEARPGIR